MQEMLDWIEARGAWAPVLYVLFYIAAAVGFVPGSLITLAGGAMFGVVKGTLLVSFASTAAAAIAFLLARFALRRRIAAKLADQPRFRAIDEAIGREGWKIVLLLRLSPVFPYNLLNYALGLTSIRFWPAVLASWLGMLPATVLFVYAGSLARVATAEMTLARKVLHGCGLLATVVVTIWIARIAKRALAGKLAPPGK